MNYNRGEIEGIVRNILHDSLTPSTAWQTIMTALNRLPQGVFLSGRLRVSFNDCRRAHFKLAQRGKTGTMTIDVSVKVDPPV